MVVYTRIEEGEPLKLGIRSGNMEGNGQTTSGFDPSGWFKVDNFRIKKVSDENTSGIVTASSKDREWPSGTYDLTGRRVSRTAEQPRGTILIKNGKKIIK